LGVGPGKLACKSAKKKGVGGAFSEKRKEAVLREGGERLWRPSLKEGERPWVKGTKRKKGHRKSK